jgi:hypothetical protein
MSEVDDPIRLQSSESNRPTEMISGSPRATKLNHSSSVTMMKKPKHQ